jgi:hypothetical protein
MDLEAHVVKLAEEHARGLHSFNGRDLLAELEVLHAHMVGLKDKCTTEAGKLSMLVKRISNALTNLGMLPIRDIPQLPKIAQEVLAMAGLIVERMLEEHESSASPWD